MAGPDDCDTDPGHETSITVTADLRVMVAIWRGDAQWQEALRTDTLIIDGPAAPRRAPPTWFPPSPFTTRPPPAVPDAGGAHQAR